MDVEDLLSRVKAFEELAVRGAQTEPFTGESLGREMTDSELARAIRLDLEAELDAINLYGSHLEATSNEKAVAILEHVIEEEQDHASLFVELIKELDPKQAEMLEGGEEHYEEIVEAAKEFELEALGAKEPPPADVKVDDLDWLDERERGLIKINGKDKEYWPHNPPASIASEKTWDRAKKAVKKYWSKYSDPWAVVFDVYRKMGGKLKKPKKRK